MSKENEYPIVFCIWEDIVQSDPNWQSKEEGLDWADSENGLVHQIGFKLDEDENHLILTDSYFKSCETIGSVIRIPKWAIKEVKILDRFTE